MSDNLFNGRPFRALTVVDNFSRGCLANHAGKSLKGEDVGDVMEELRVLSKRQPVSIQTDNSSKFTSESLDKWAYENGGVTVPLIGICASQTRQVAQGI
ncbi:DDE-type integrase/transposase/recombinase [Enterobacter mori]